MTMTELFLVMIKPRGNAKNYRVKEGQWACFETTTSLELAAGTVQVLTNAGTPAKVQSILIDDNGNIQL
tara:strand:+ start:1450 stop:1656 length:207 start_codon:yes stop_codon:yes gene_type:complete